MIKPIDKDDPRKPFGVVDIENSKNGDVLSVGVFDGKNIVVCDGWDTATKVMFSSEPKIYWAHNGSGWDWLSLLDYSVSKGYKVRLSVAHWRMIEMTIVTKDGGKIRCRDSMRITGRGLDASSKMFGGQGKKDIGNLTHEELWKNHRSKFYEYLEHDVAITRDLVSSLESSLRTLGSPGLRVTAASTAMATFRRGLKDSIPVPIEPSVREALRSAYKGGRVQCLQPGEHRKVWVYDVNSMFAAVMRTTPMPCGTYRKARKLDLDDPCAVYQVEWEQSEPNDLFPGSSGAGWYHAVELKRFVGSLRFLDGYSCDKTSDSMFVEYVDRFWDARKKGIESAKLMLCSLYGKFGQRGEVTELLAPIQIEDVVRALANGSSVTQLDDNDAMVVTTEKEVPWEHCGIAGIITAEARGRLCDMMRKHKGRVVYVDTDSVHITRSDGPGTKDLGGWKLVEEGVSGAYAGPKMYTVGGKVVAKGVSKAYLTDKDIISLCQGERKIAAYQSATTLRQWSMGAKPCRIGLKQRTIRQTTR